MPAAPEYVTRAYKRIKESYPFFVCLKKIGGRYYLYKQTTKWDKEKKKQKVVTEYLGKIALDGRFIKKVAGFSGDLGKAMAVIESYGGTVVLPEKREGKPITALDLDVSEVDDKLLTVLSMNARADLSYFGKQMGLTASATYSRIKHLERKYGIRYMPEIDIRKLGYLTYVIFVKFAERPPSSGLVREALRKEPIVQLALLTQGRYDLVMYITVENSEEAITQIYEMEKSAFSSYKSEWYVVPFYTTYGFVPLRHEFFDMLAKSVWKRTREQPRKLQNQLTQHEYITLRELNSDGAAKFADIDKKHGFVGEGAAYTYRKLTDSRLLKRMTISMQNLPLKYTAIILADKIDRDKYAESREKLLKMVIEKTRTPVNKYTLIGDKWMPTGIMFAIPVFEEGDLEKAEADLKETMAGMRLDKLIVLETVVGSLCFRRFDNDHSNQHNLLIKEYGLNDAPKTNYEETGRSRNAYMHEDENPIEEDT